MRIVDTIVIHCSATREDINYSFDQCTRDHKARGFRKCGYHFYITKDGTIHIGRLLSEVGAHVGKDGNRNSIGICYEGGIRAKGNPANPKDAIDTRTPEQKKAILKCIAESMAYGQIKQIVGHRDLSPDLNGNGVIEPKEWIKMCPCFDAIPEYKHLIK
jgi:N-acetyl-anhydromuramyl-L-alanine amidase AmpD